MFLAIYTEVRGTFDCCGVSGEMRGFFASLRMTIKNNYKTITTTTTTTTIASAATSTAIAGRDSKGNRRHLPCYLAADSRMAAEWFRASVRLASWVWARVESFASIPSVTPGMTTAA